MLLMSVDKSSLFPKNEGKTHFNIYSKSRTDLGRFLSHFQYHPIETEDGVFDSMEGYWYWLELRYDGLRKVYGYDAKRLGESLRSKRRGANIIVPDFELKILKATTIKLQTMPGDLRNKLLSSRLPLIHAYVSNEKYSIQKSMDNIIKHINSWRMNNGRI